VLYLQENIYYYPYSMKRKITHIRLILLLAFLFVIQPGSYAQVYQHDFGTTAISAHPYTVAPAIIDANLSGSSWSNSTSAWTSFAGSAGQAIAMANTAGTPTITLTFTVAAGKQLSISSYNFWRQRSGTGAQAFAMSINGIPVGVGSITTSGAATGNIPVALPVVGLTGTVNVVLSLSGATGSGTVRIDDFTLNGTVTSNCIAPLITSIYPASGPTNTLVTITGAGFNLGSGTSAVNFNGQPSSGFTVVSDTQIKAIAPLNASTGTLTVTTNGCEGNAGTFTVIHSDCPVATGPTDLFISEIYDADAGEGGAVELYNGTSSPIDLSIYSLARYADIGDALAASTVNLSGILAPGATYIARTSTPVCSLSGTPATTLATGFNANDEFKLFKNSIVIDDVQLPNQTGYSVIRDADASVPQSTYNAADWTISLVESCANLGVHTTSTSTQSQITAQPLSAAICEGGTVTYSVTLNNVTGFSYQWKMLNSSGAWVNITDNNVFSGATTANLTITDAPLNLNSAQFYCAVPSAGCTLISNAVQLTVSPLPVVIITSVQPTCITPTGSILIVPSIGDSLTYSLNGTTYQSSVLFTSLTPGTYTLYVKSSSNCVSEVPFTINPVPSLPAVASVTVTQPTCGVATGSVTIDSPLDLGLTYSIDGSLFQSGTTFSNLAPGTYTITVMTALGCTSVTANITINAAPVTPAVATVTTTQPNCTTATGTITVTAPLGAGLTYSIDGTNFQSGTAFTGLAAGSYTITVKTTDGCTSVTPVATTINAAPVVPAIATTTVTQPTCTVPTGSITVTTPVGASYTYSINGGTYQSSPVFSNLAAGSYTITTQSSGGCTSVTAAITITAAPSAPAVATTTVTQPTCTVPTGTITVTAPTGAGLTYSINGGTYQSNATFTGLAAGSYTITTQNAGGCTSVTSAITINTAPVVPSVATTTVTQPTCTIATGSVTVTAPVGAAYTYSLNGGAYQASPAFTNLAPGSYTITTQATGGCTSDTSAITINAAPTAPAVATTTVSQPTCTSPGGIITVTAPTGAGFTYSINGGAFQSNTVFSGLAAGSYTITTQNAAGCTSTTTAITIDTVPAAPAVATTTVTQPTCTAATGTITITAPTGAGLMYSLNGGTAQTTTTFTGLAAGNYTVTTQNSAGCSSITGTITINPAPAVPLTPTLSVTQATCTTTSGTITVNAPVGAGFTYSINGGASQTGTTFTGLAAGTYTVTTQNAAGCTATSSTVTIDAVPTPPVTPVVSVTQPDCATVSKGSITVTSPTGAGYTYSIDGTTYQAGTTFNDLAGGSYTVTVQNASGCTSSVTVTINAGGTTPNVATTTQTQPTCTVATGSITVNAPVGAGLTYSIDGGTTWQTTTTFANLPAGAYQVTVMNAGGCTSVTPQIAINPSPVPAAAVTTITQPTCFTTQGSVTITSPVGSGLTYSIDGTTFQNGTSFINLASGSYNITIQNAQGCTSVTPVIINPAPEVPSAPTLTIIQPTCDAPGGIVTVTSPAGAGYTYSIDGTNFQAGTTFNNLEAGSYNVVVTNASGCSVTASNITIIDASGVLQLAASEGCEQTGNGNHYILHVMPVNGSFDENAVTYSWMNEGGLVVSTESSFDATQYAHNFIVNPDQYPLEFTVTVTTAGGCSGSATFSVGGTFCDIPRGISPNGDNKNDNFDISGMNASKVSIFNRFGQQVYTQNNYTNEWFGQTDNNEELPSGTYYYVVVLPSETKTGWVYINRENE